MRLVLKRDEFMRTIAACMSVVQKKNTIPILGTLLLEFDGETLSVRGTNLDIEATGRVACEGEPGAVCIEAAKLHKIVSKLDASELTITEKGSSAELKAGKSRFKLHVMPKADFPTIDVGEYDTEFTLDIASLYAPIKFAVSTEQSRYYLNGVFITTNEDGRIEAVATDGHRLARTIGPECPSFGPGVIVPGQMVELAPKGEISVAVSANKIRYATETTTIVSKLIEGTYPDYLRVIPKNNEKRIEAQSADLSKAAARVAAISEDRARGVKMTFDDGAASFYATSTGEEASDEIACDYNGEAVSIGFNSRYLAEMMAALPAGDVELHLNDESTPALIKSPSAPDWTGVLMPMRVS